MRDKFTGADWIALAILMGLGWLAAEAAQQAVEDKVEAEELAAAQ